eukprot:Amastigsp_a843262_577.p4 type:complete len:149 gc:universal Amastigsp_a843262_577:553-999(+)
MTCFGLRRLSFSRTEWVEPPRTTIDRTQMINVDVRTEWPWAVGTLSERAKASAPRSPANQRKLNSCFVSWYSRDRKRLSTAPSGKMNAARAMTMAKIEASMSPKLNSWRKENTENPSDKNTKVSHMYAKGWNAFWVTCRASSERFGRR